jgi:cytochrome c oxidase cbb3-type subunit 3
MSQETPEIADYARLDETPRDGIGEEDNPIPLWFNLGFYGFIVFGIVYILFYTLSGWSSRGQYEAQVAAAAKRAEAVRAALPTENPFRGDPAAIAQGAETFKTICAACHKPDGTGLVGPSLVDPYWKYGDTDDDLFHSVYDGRPGGMPAWGPQLGADKIWKALAYMQSLPKSKQPGLGAPDYRPPGS